MDLEWWDNGKENVSYGSILGLHRDNGREHGSYYLGFSDTEAGLPREAWVEEVLYDLGKALYGRERFGM